LSDSISRQATIGTKNVGAMPLQKLVASVLLSMLIILLKYVANAYFVKTVKRTWSVIAHCFSSSCSQRFVVICSTMFSGPLLSAEVVHRIDSFFRRSFHYGSISKVVMVQPLLIQPWKIFPVIHSHPTIVFTHCFLR